MEGICCVTFEKNNLKNFISVTALHNSYDIFSKQKLVYYV